MANSELCFVNLSMDNAFWLSRSAQKETIWINVHCWGSLAKLNDLVDFVTDHNMLYTAFTYQDAPQQFKEKNKDEYKFISHYKRNILSFLFIIALIYICFVWYCGLVLDIELKYKANQSGGMILLEQRKECRDAIGI